MPWPTRDHRRLRVFLRVTLTQAMSDVARSRGPSVSLPSRHSARGAPLVRLSDRPVPDNRGPGASQCFAPCDDGAWDGLDGGLDWAGILPARHLSIISLALKTHSISSPAIFRAPTHLGPDGTNAGMRRSGHCGRQAKRLDHHRCSLYVLYMSTQPNRQPFPVRYRFPIEPPPLSSSGQPTRPPPTARRPDIA